MLAEKEVESVDIVKNSTTAKFTAWSKHCGKYYDALTNLLVESKYILSKDIMTAHALVTDIQIRTEKVPFEGRNVDMSDDLFYWVSMSIRGRELRDLFVPIER